MVEIYQINAFSDVAAPGKDIILSLPMDNGVNLFNC